MSKFFPSLSEHSREVEELYDEIGYERILILGGFVKTTLSSALIGGGCTLVLAGATQHSLIVNNPTYQFNVGILAILAGIFIVWLIDLERKEYKKKEIQIYNDNLQRQAHKIAEEMVKEELVKIECKSRK